MQEIRTLALPSADASTSVAALFAPPPSTEFVAGSTKAGLGSPAPKRQKVAVAQKDIAGRHETNVAEPLL